MIAYRDREHNMPPAPTVSAGPCALAIIALAAFFNLLDLFGPQAIAPTMAHAFATSAQSMGVAVNIAVLGMTFAGFIAIPFGDRIGRKPLMVGALGALALPTALIAAAPNLFCLEALRLLEGLLMCAGFAAAIAYVAEEWGPLNSAPLMMGAYLTGNVAANILGRVIAGVVTDCADWKFTFVAFAALNLIGAVLLQIALPTSRAQLPEGSGTGLRNLRAHLTNPALRGAFAVGYLILFAFVGVFTYINFRLAGPPFRLSPASIGLLYFVFLPSLGVTLAVGRVVRSIGYRNAFVGGALFSLVGAGITLTNTLSLLLLGLAFTGAGLFFCQAVATAFTGHTAKHAKCAASGLYLAIYYTGGLCGAWAMGVVFSATGWAGCAAAAAAASILMAGIAGITWRAPTAMARVLAAELRA